MSAYWKLFDTVTNEDDARAITDEFGRRRISTSHELRKEIASAKCVSQSKATRIHSNIDQLRAALKAQGR